MDDFEPDFDVLEQGDELYEHEQNELDRDTFVECEDDWDYESELEEVES